MNCPDKNNCPLHRSEEPCRPDEVKACVSWATNGPAANPSDTPSIDEETTAVKQLLVAAVADDFDQWRGFSTG